MPIEFKDLLNMDEDEMNKELMLINEPMRIVANKYNDCVILSAVILKKNGLLVADNGYTNDADVNSVLHIEDKLFDVSMHLKVITSYSDDEGMNKETMC
jgi:hypothetical protein